MAEGLKGFSKVRLDGLDEDEEEVRQRSSQRACARYKAAQDAYSAAKFSRDKLLALFEEAEAAMAPLMHNGLMGLSPQELEAVLKGRLHQAVLLAQLEQVPDRWPRVRAFAEDVLQFDFNNCHARWLRALSLQGDKPQRAEALEEMRRAVECARASGKHSEADLWESELLRVSGELDAGAACGTPAAARPEPVMQKGFLNRRAKAPPPAQPPGSAAQMAASSDAAGPPPPSAAPGAASPPAAPLLEHLQEEHHAQTEELRRNLREERERALHREQEVARWQQSVTDELGVVGTEMEEVLVREVHAFAMADLNDYNKRQSASLRRGRAAALDARELHQASKAWADAEHEQLLDVSTEVLTLREMSARELNERQEASRQQSAELRDLARKMADLRGAAKALRDCLRLRFAGEPQKDDEEPDLQRLMETAAGFHALPLSTKLSALLDDATVLRLAALAWLLGMFAALGILVEVFNSMKCRFACAR